MDRHRMYRLERYADCLFLLFLFLLPFQTVYLLREPMIGGEKWQYGTIGIYVSTIALAFAVLLGVISRFDSSGAVSLKDRIVALLIGGRNEFYLLLMVLWAGISVLWASDQVLALYGFVILLLAADAFIMIRDMVRRGKRRRIVAVLIVSAAIQALIGIWQFLAQDTLASTFLGTAAHPVWQAGTSVLKNGSGRWIRAYGTFMHPNAFGLFVAVSLLLVIWHVIDMSGRPIGANIRKRATLVAAMPILLFGLLVSFSRLAWGGFVMGLVALVASYILRSKEREVKRYSAAVMAFLLLSGSLFCLVLRETVYPRFDSATVNEEGSVTDRMTTYRDALRVIRESPLLGSGMWNSTAELIRLDPARPVWEIQPAHDVPLLVLTELGVPGLAFVSIVLAGLLLASVRRKNITALAMFFVFVPSLLLDHFLWDSVSGLLFLSVWLGLVRADIST